jgi:REP element-mobilizing transposase RayT
VRFTGLQARAVGRGFARYVGRSGLAVWGCAILPDHVHLVVEPPGMKIEQLAIQLKGSASRQLELERIHPLIAYREPGQRIPQCWVRGQWKVYLDVDDIPRAIAYVENNPVKDGKPRQHWSFVSPYEPPSLPDALRVASRLTADGG